MIPTKNLAVIGASGYVGRALLDLLARHPGARAEHAMSGRAGTEPAAPSLHVDPPFSHPSSLMVEPLDMSVLADMDGVFVCLPPGVAGPIASAVRELGPCVVDLSSDFRLNRDVAYGLTELSRGRVRESRLVANPGCYPTSILLPVVPLLGGDLLDPHAPIIADSKSGVSGAGNKPTERTLFGNVHDNCMAYGVGDHRHLPEIRQHAGTDHITFVPHLLPMFRGILSTIYVAPRVAEKAGVNADRVREFLCHTYAGEPFVRVFQHGLPQVDRVANTNYCDIGVAECGGHVVIVSAIDNLVKGAAGQALQNMNLMLDLDEVAGLLP